MAKPQISTRVDDELKQQIDEYAEENNTSKAEAMRILLRDGLEYDSTEEIREGMGKIIQDGGHVLADDMDQLEVGQQELKGEVDSRLEDLEEKLTQVQAELEQTQSRQSTLVILAAILFIVASASVSTVVGLLGYVLLGVVLLYYVYVIDFAGIAQLVSGGDDQ
jgi:Ribbon-helix-helix protein, copG family.